MSGGKLLCWSPLERLGQRSAPPGQGSAVLAAAGRGRAAHAQPGAPVPKVPGGTRERWGHPRHGLEHSTEHSRGQPWDMDPRAICGQGRAELGTAQHCSQAELPVPAPSDTEKYSDHLASILSSRMLIP